MSEIGNHLPPRAHARGPRRSRVSTSERVCVHERARVRVPKMTNERRVYLRTTRNRGTLRGRKTTEGRSGKGKGATGIKMKTLGRPERRMASADYDGDEP